MDSYIGTIMLWPMKWASKGWEFCDGRILQVAQNETLYAVIGNTYGGVPWRTFALPNLQGIAPQGTGPFEETGG